MCSPVHERTVTVPEHPAAQAPAVVEIGIVVGESCHGGFQVGQRPLVLAEVLERDGPVRA